MSANDLRQNDSTRGILLDIRAAPRLAAISGGFAMARAHTTRAARAAFVSFLAFAVARPVFGGGLSFVEYQAPPTGPTNEGLRNDEVMAVSPDGLNLYTASHSEDSIGVFTRNPTTGALTFLEVEEENVGGVDGIRDTSGVTVSPDGKCVYASGTVEDKLAVFDRSTVDGSLAFLQVKEDGVGGVSGMRRPAAVVVSPDDLHVYVTAILGPVTTAVVAFSRTPPACGLTYVETETGDASGLGKELTPGLAITDDGAHLYVGGTFSSGGTTRGAVNVLSRNAVTGALTFVEREYNFNGGIDRLAIHVRTVAVSPDGQSVYAGSSNDDAVTAFSRNAGTGDITFVQTVRDGAGNDGLKSPTALIVSADNAYLYTVGHGDEAVAVYRRDTTTGTVRFLEVHKDPNIDPAMDVLPAVQGAALSPAGDSLYAGNKGVAVFAVDACGNGTVGTDEQCDDGNLVAGDGCSATCRLELCGPTPAVGCRGTAPLGAALKITNATPDTKDQLQWKWNKGDATPLGDYGNPVASTSYVLCLYDASANPQPLLGAAAPAGGTCKSGKPCWRASSSSYKYSDGLLTPDGWQLVQLKEGLVNGKAAIQFKGKGINLLPPALPLTLPVTVQVKDTANGICWDAVFTAATTNDGTKFKGKGD
jgi:cysteine-rich repeat protein